MNRPIPLFLVLCLVSLRASGQTVPFDEDIQRIDTHFAHEPTVRAVQLAAIKHARVHPEAMGDWSARARWSAVLPEAFEGRVTLEGGEDDQYTTREDLALGDLGGFAVDDLRLTEQDGTTDKWRVSLMARWDLSDTIFNTDELSVSGESARRLRARDEVALVVTEIYFERRKQQIQRLLTPPQTRLEAVALDLSIDGLTAKLDGLTGGWFSEAVTDGAALRKGPALPEPASTPPRSEGRAPH